MDTVQKIFGVRPPKVFKTKSSAVPCSFPELVLGVELETENARRFADDYIIYSESRGNFWQVERDGSLRGEGAYEFISYPTQMQYALAELSEFFNFTQFNDDNYTDRCSVHVHTNVTDFTQDMLASLALVYTVVEELLFHYVNHFKSRTEDGYSRDTNLYCIPWNQCRMNHRLVEKIFNPTATKPFARWQKYTALNLLPIMDRGSVEWRHMHGTADMEKLTGWLNIIGGIVQYAKNRSLDSVIKTIKELNDTSAYRQFFSDVFREYLPYDDRNATILSEGVINAKYSLMDWDRSKVEKNAPKAKSKVISDTMWQLPAEETLAQIDRVAREMRAERDRIVQAPPIQPRRPVRPAPRGAWRQNVPRQVLAEGNNQADNGFVEDLQRRGLLHAEPLPAAMEGTVRMNFADEIINGEDHE